MTDSNIPRNLSEAIKTLIEIVEPTEYEILKTHDSSEFHHTFGRELRNMWKMWDENSPLRKWFIDNYGIGHPDDVSGIILETFKRFISNQPLKVEEQAKTYREYWIRYNTDPATQRSFNEIFLSNH